MGMGHLLTGVKKISKENLYCLREQLDLNSTGYKNILLMLAMRNAASAPLVDR